VHYRRLRNDVDLAVLSADSTALGPVVAFLVAELHDAVTAASIVVAARAALALPADVEASSQSSHGTPLELQQLQLADFA